MRGSFFSTLVAGLLGAACAGPPANEAPHDSLRVALLTPGPISDQACNGEAYRGLVAVKDSFGAAISHIQTRTPASFDENFREYGKQGYDLVFGHGFEYKDAAERIAPSYPKTVFLVTSSEVSGPNIDGIRFSFSQPSYLAGIAAAGASRSGVIGAIGGTELPPVRESSAAYLTVARQVRDHTPLPGVFALGAETGVVRFVVNPTLSDRIGGVARQRFDSTWTTMAAGQWQLPVSR